MTQLIATDIFQKINNLPSLPLVVMELLSSLDQEDVNIDVLVHKIAQDQALTAKTLRLANSSFYGMARQISAIHEAIAILGFRTVRNLATTAALIGAFSGGVHPRFNITSFWRHSIATAVCARELAIPLHLNPDHAYTAGLLHDIGRLVLLSQFRSNYEATMDYRALHDCSLLSAELAVLGVDHSAIGYELTRHWKFPESMQKAVANHHERQLQNLPELSLLIIAANTIAHALDLSRDDNDLVPSIPAGLWTQLGLDEKALHEVFKKTEMLVEAACQILDTEMEKTQ